MGKKKSRIFNRKKKKSVFSRPHPMRRKMMLRHRRMKAFFHKHNPRPKIERGIRKMVGGIYNVSDRVRDKIAESDLIVTIHKHIPKPKLEKGIRKMFGGIYDVSDKVKDRITGL